MTRLLSDSLQPTSALVDSDSMRTSSFSGVSGESSTSVISPLALPSRGAHGGAHGYFDYQNSSSSGSRDRLASPAPQGSTTNPVPDSRATRSVRSPLSSSSRALPQPEPPMFLSPHLTPTSTQIHQQMQQERRRQQRSASLSPTRRAASVGSHGMGRTRSAVGSPSNMPYAMLPLDGALNGVRSPPSVSAGPACGYSVSSFTGRSVSVDGSNPQTYQTIIQQLKQQNKVIREAWENERKYLEANRARAEEVYREERAIMEVERTEWDLERAMLLERIRILEGRSSSIDSLRFSRPHRIDEEPSVLMLDNPRNGSIDASPESLRGSETSLARGQILNGDSFNNLSSQTAIPRSYPIQPAELASSQTLTRLPPESAPFISLPQQAQPDFLADDEPAEVLLDARGAPIPSVDVQEIHPELEGILIKAKAIKKPTFTDGDTSASDSKSSSEKPSPPSEPEPEPTLVLAKVSSKEQTLQVLAAAEDRRLTMHAGHTPSHSLSVLPSTQGTAATTASSSGENTPTIQLGADGLILADPRPQSAAPKKRPEMHAEPQHAEIAADEDHPERLMEPSEGDAELKGPLMIRNIPAHDEVFFRRLSEKLEDVVQNDEAPTVLQGPEPPQAAPVELNAEPVLAKVDGDEVIEAQKPKERSSSTSSVGSKTGGDEPDIPLKLKISNNFGAPFGAVRPTVF
ncbi:uncharacterized protein E0L32_005013 [Thyridium curvatum]|uniref:Uncharacterized protein n=1 Tax=Thyridium curvatum TaxID=1093900 RepID=A0A507B8G6_9PEZI|nr:uncharacterized protein E0L32_005013 [Thyridium curvatum]TPX14904.1 hypothetical protein E0L32_005013 [Thyridium curvatum]